jgi:hypothetical protein
MDTNTSNQTIISNQTVTMNTKPDEQRLKTILRNRQMGLWTTDDTLYDVNLAFAQHCDGGDNEKAAFLHRGACAMMLLNNSELLSELKSWKKLGCVVDPKNTQEIELNGRKAWLWVLQPKKAKNNTPICPVAMALGIMVSGFSYISKDKATEELVVRYLKKTK